MNPAIIMAALQAGGDLVGAVQGEATRKKRKKKYIEGERDETNYQISRDWAQQMGMPTYDLDAKHRAKQVHQRADEQFAFDPMSFVPFAKSAGRVSQGIYDEATAPEKMDFGQDADGFEYDKDELSRVEEEERRRRQMDFIAQANPWGAYSRGY